MHQIEVLYVMFVSVLTAMTVFDYKVASALTIGAWLQYWFAVNKSFKLYALIAVSTVFVAFAILKPIMDFTEVPFESPIRILVYSLTALISVEIISIIIKLLPSAISKKFKDKFNLPDGGEND